MPAGTKVHSCVSKLKGKMPTGQAIATCQKSTGKSYMTGRKPKKSKKK